jgi:hypothetical protein
MELYTKSSRNESPNLNFSPPCCHRCGGPAPRRGRMSAAVEDDSGRARRLYLCARCVASLILWRAPYQTPLKREQQRERFQSRRTYRGDRRVAA